MDSTFWTIFSPILVGFAMAGTAAAFYALHLAVQLHIKVTAMEKSTHSIQYVPAEDLRETLDEELNQAVNTREHEEWANIGDIHQKTEPLM